MALISLGSGTQSDLCLSNIGSWLTLDKLASGANILSALAALVTAWYAKKAISTWVQQKKSQLAEEVIISAHNLRGVIVWVRCPAAFRGEGKSRSGNESTESEDIKHDKNSYFIPIERLHKSQPVMSEAQKLIIKADIHFKGVAPLLKEMLEIINEINSAAHSLVRTVGTNYPVSNKEKHEEKQKKIWDGYADPDIYNERLNNIVKELEDILRRWI